MDLTLSEEQRLFADALSRFLEKEYAFEHRRALVADKAWGDAVIWNQLAELGCFGLAVPEAVGGFGGGAFDIGLMMRALGRHLAIEPVMSTIVAGTLLGGARDAGEHVEALIEGSIRYAPVFGLSHKDGVLSGTARSLRGAYRADRLLLAMEDGLFFLDLAGLPVEPVPLLDDTVGIDIAFDSVPATRIETGNDWQSWYALALGRAEVARGWQALGTMEGALDATRDYVRERRQFGRPLSDFQTVQHRVAEMIVATKEAEVAATLGALALDAATIARDADRGLSVATARIAAAASIVADNAVQLHGGMGVSDELDIAARFRSLQAYRAHARAVDRPVERYAATVIASNAHHGSAVLMEA